VFKTVLHSLSPNYSQALAKILSWVFGFDTKIEVLKKRKADSASRSFIFQVTAKVTRADNYSATDPESRAPRHYDSTEVRDCSQSWRY
jgi:hypothetical protein